MFLSPAALLRHHHQPQVHHLSRHHKTTQHTIIARIPTPVEELAQFQLQTIFWAVMRALWMTKRYTAGWWAGTTTTRSLYRSCTAVSRLTLSGPPTTSMRLRKLSRRMPTSSCLYFGVICFCFLKSCSSGACSYDSNDTQMTWTSFFGCKAMPRKLVVPSEPHCDGWTPKTQA